MSLIEINWCPKRKELRNFGIIALIASIVLSLLLFWLKNLDIKWLIAICCIGFTIFLCSIISDKLTRIIYLGLMLVTLPVGWIVSFILLASFYFLLLTPLGLIFRLIGRDTLHRKFDPKAESCWLKWHPPNTTERYFHQF
jgi:hypothetical protein